MLFLAPCEDHTVQVLFSENRNPNRMVQSGKYTNDGIGVNFVKVLLDCLSTKQQFRGKWRFHRKTGPLLRSLSVFTVPDRAVETFDLPIAHQSIHIPLQPNAETARVLR